MRFLQTKTPMTVIFVSEGESDVSHGEHDRFLLYMMMMTTCHIYGHAVKAVITIIVM